MPKQHYVVVGISRDADVGKVRRARRKLVEPYQREEEIALARQPEPADDEGPSRRHDEGTAPEPPSGGRATARALPTGGTPRRAASLLERIEGLYGVVDEFMEGWVPGIFTRGPTASKRKDLYVEVMLEPHEAARGGLFPLRVPVRELCDQCDGTGTRGLFYCSSCRGTGLVRGFREVEISMPARVADGTTARLSLEDIGLKGVDLHVLVSVRPSGATR